MFYTLELRKLSSKRSTDCIIMTLFKLTSYFYLINMATECPCVYLYSKIKSFIYSLYIYIFYTHLVAITSLSSWHS